MIDCLGPRSNRPAPPPAESQLCGSGALWVLLRDGDPECQGPIRDGLLDCAMFIFGYAVMRVVHCCSCLLALDVRLE